MRTYTLPAARFHELDPDARAALSAYVTEQLGPNVFATVLELHFTEPDPDELDVPTWLDALVLPLGSDTHVAKANVPEPPVLRHWIRPDEPAAGDPAPVIEPAKPTRRRR